MVHGTALAVSSGRVEELSEDDRERLRRAHHRLRKASQELEALTAPRPVRGRWDFVAAPPEVMGTVRAELADAYREVTSLHDELLDWQPPADAGPPAEP